ncbi:MAG: hypothetical protein JWO30_3142 [Fibrobacteres bacterium]|nr:hypothetical protein [Fibrobacterota bacterium]
MKWSRASALIPLFVVFGFDNVSSQLTFPVRGAFYYSWYPATWGVAGSHVFYQPDLGYYSSDDQAVVDQHIKALDYAKVDVAIASWWGINQQSESKRFPVMLGRTVAAGSKIKWAIYYEKEGFGNPTVAQIQTDLAYVKQNYVTHPNYATVNGKPVVFVYNADDNTCEVADRWAEATNGEWYVGLKVVGGYQSCAHQPSTWHQYGPNSPEQRQTGYAIVIAPGFWRADAATPLLVRDPVRFAQNVRNMVKSGEHWQLITTFNEWGEGTAVESAKDWKSASGFGLYLDALHNDGNPASIADPRTNDAGKNGLAHGGIAKVDVYNLKGKLITTAGNGTFADYGAEIDKNGFTGGVYLIKPKSGKSGSSREPVKVVNLR